MGKFYQKNKTKIEVNDMKCYTETGWRLGIGGNMKNNNNLNTSKLK